MSLFRGQFHKTCFSSVSCDKAQCIVGPTSAGRYPNSRTDPAICYAPRQHTGRIDLSPCAATYRRAAAGLPRGLSQFSRRDGQCSANQLLAAKMGLSPLRRVKGTGPCFRPTVCSQNTSVRRKMDQSPTMVGTLTNSTATACYAWRRDSSSSISPSCPALIFRLAVSTSKNSARSHSGNSRCWPECGGHSMVKVLLVSVVGSQSP